MNKHKTRLGIYGGTFSPPHAGHVKAADAFFKEAKLDKLLIMPAYVSPFKQNNTVSSDHRLQMARLAFSELNGYNDRIFVSDYEAARTEISYTANTLRHFADNSVELIFLCGTDMFLSLDRWYQPEVIFSLATIACMRREQSSDYDLPIAQAKTRYEQNFNARIIEVSCPPIEVSSTELRSLLAIGGNTDGLLAPAVQKYIKEHGLYHD